jgi:asparagine synthase (glutamine-hydrolysing)
VQGYPPPKPSSGEWIHITPGITVMPVLHGWVEVNGTCLKAREVYHILDGCPEYIGTFGGEFYLTDGELAARDHFGIMPGDCPPGAVTLKKNIIGDVNPDPPEMELEAAIIEAVRLRRGEGVTALSGGVDSALIAVLAGLPCIAVGTEGSHDIGRAAHVAETTDLSVSCKIITEQDVLEGLSAVIPVIPSHDPVNTSIAVTMFCITRLARELGYCRVLAGQGADELFGGYARYLSSSDLEADLRKDFSGLTLQAARDQAVAALHGTYISMPYLDIRVVRAARRIPAREKVMGSVRKKPLRIVAECHIPAEIAWYDKKAMQYGSGVWRMIQGLARHNGYKRSVQGYINQFCEHDHDIAKGC